MSEGKEAVFMSEKKKKKGAGAKRLRVMIIIAMLTAMTIALERVPGLSIKTPGWKICFAFIAPMTAAMLLGPVEAAIVYGLADLIGALLLPFGPYHPGFTAIAALMGFLMGVFMNKRPFAAFGSDFEWKKIRFFTNLMPPILINCLILGLLVNTVWVAQLYGSRTYSGWFVYRLWEYLILVPVQLALAPAILKLCGVLGRTGIMRRINGEGTPAGDGKAARSGVIASSRNESILGLERITELLRLMGDPQDGLRVIHIAGTNGKGSVSAMLSSVLAASAYRTGSFNSPALTGARDGFRIDLATVGQDELDEVLAYIEPFAAGMSEKPTEFEVLTAAAFELFRREGCEAVVMECGLGGDGDSTNVIKDPVLSIITNVRLDHTDRLGKTVEEIAAHKAGIIKKGRPVVYGGRDENAFAVIAERAEEQGSKLVRTDFSRLRVISETLDCTEIEFAGEGRLRLGLIGAYQPENAATALTAVEVLREEGFVIPESAVALGLRSAVWPARFEIMHRKPLVIFDGAHNPDGVARTAESIRTLFKGKKPVVLMGVMADKDYAQYPELLGGLVSKVYTVTPANPRSLDAPALASRFSEAGFIAKPCTSMENAVRAAYIFSQKHGVPLIAMGTLYMYNEFKDALNSITDNIRKDGKKR